MNFHKTSIGGVWIVEFERIEDERGVFARTWDADELAARRLEAGLVQCSVSYNRSRRTHRGNALPSSAIRGDEARSVHSGRDLRRRPRAAGRLVDVLRVGRGRVLRGQSTRALHSARVRASSPVPSSADDLGLLDADRLEEALHTALDIVEVLAADATYRNLSPKGEPQLGRRGSRLGNR